MQSVYIRYEWYPSKEGIEGRFECRYAHRKKDVNMKAKISVMHLQAKGWQR